MSWGGGGQGGLAWPTDCPVALLACHLCGAGRPLLSRSPLPPVCAYIAARLAPIPPPRPGCRSPRPRGGPGRRTLWVVCGGGVLAAGRLMERCDAGNESDGYEVVVNGELKGSRSWFDQNIASSSKACDAGARRVGPGRDPTGRSSPPTRGSGGLSTVSARRLCCVVEPCCRIGSGARLPTLRRARPASGTMPSSFSVRLRGATGGVRRRRLSGRVIRAPPPRLRQCLRTPAAKASTRQRARRRRAATRAPFSIAVYDMVDANRYLWWIGMGIHHSGVQVHGREWAFGGGNDDGSGIWCAQPRVAPPGVVFRSAHSLGRTRMTPDEVTRLMTALGTQRGGYRARDYHLLKRNCNTFVVAASAALLEKTPARERRRPPGWINRLAGVAQRAQCLLPPGLALEATVAAPPCPSDGGEPLQSVEGRERARLLAPLQEERGSVETS